MISKSEMFEASDRIHHRITSVLYDWAKREGNNLEGFINTPSEHVEYNPYVILDFTALTKRLSMLRYVEEQLNIVTKYKLSDPDVTRSMYEYAIETVPEILFKRLLDWMEKRKKDMEGVMLGEAGSMAPLKDYEGMFTFNSTKFMAEYAMYKEAVEATKVIVAYKKQQAAPPQNETEEQPPNDGNVEPEYPGPAGESGE